jgi:hypothetical protein
VEPEVREDEILPLSTDPFSHPHLDLPDPTDVVDPVERAFGQRRAIPIAVLDARASAARERTRMPARATEFV